MRTAIIFSGTSYNFKFSVESLMKNLIIPNDADVFILTSRYNMRRRTVATEKKYLVENWSDWVEKSLTIERNDTSVTEADIQLIKDAFGNRLKGLYFIDDMPDYQLHLARERNRLMDLINFYRSNNMPAPFGGDVTDSNNGNIRCIIDQYNHVKKCFELMKRYEISNGKYDYVMRVRLDFICPFEFNISHYYLGQDFHYLYSCGSFRTDPMEWADEFCFFAPRDIAENVFMNMDKMGFVPAGKRITVNESNDFIFAPETQFSLLLHELDIKVRNVKIFRSGYYSHGGDGYDYMNYRFRRDDISLEHEYEIACIGPSDINEHLPVLREYAEKCETITELGTRYGNSTMAFMASKKKVITYDVQHNDKLDYLKEMGRQNNLDFEIKLINPQEIEETDLLFIDTDHHVEQCSKELGLHHSKVKKYLIFHDVVSFWEKGQGHESGGGLRYAIEPFMNSHPEWKQVYRAENNNGLLILERC